MAARWRTGPEAAGEDADYYWLVPRNIVSHVTGLDYHCNKGIGMEPNTL